MTVTVTRLDKAKCPAVTFKHGSVTFNSQAVEKLDDCQFIQLLINPEKKSMIATPCDGDDKNSLQWSKAGKRVKTAPRVLRGKLFTEKLYRDMKWDIGSTVKVFGTLFKCKDEKLFVFDLGAV
ncbi:MAG: hypothetical protein LBH44_01735 [Treponema sp.]|jgi:hypothetical protein|nr:hypothetical protein [Treponema sp.]